MREIKFRGKDKNGEWYEGYLLYRDSSICIQEVFNMPPTPSDPGGDMIINFIPVLPETVGQYTGLKDKNGKEIYEGDKLEEEKGYHFEVFYNDKWAGFELRSITRSIQYPGWNRGVKMEIIGNIHEEVKIG